MKTKAQLHRVSYDISCSLAGVILLKVQTVELHLRKCGETTTRAMHRGKHEVCSKFRFQLCCG